MAVLNVPNDLLAPVERALRPWLPARLASGLCEFATFGLKEAASCAFAGSFLLLLALSSHIALPGVARYDLLFLGAIAIQGVLIATRLETWREVAVLSLFHALGMLLELFKTSPGVASWAYPEPALLRIATVPLYSGFMYAAVASYIMQAWRLLELRMSEFPRFGLAVGLCAAIYGNFFTNHYMLDLRWPLAAGVWLAFRRTRVHFRVTERERSMPLVLSFVLIACFIWVAENICTFFGAWVYPHQQAQWELVRAHKISSWMLLVILSTIIVAALKEVFPRAAGLPDPPAAPAAGRSAGATL